MKTPKTLFPILLVILGLVVVGSLVWKVQNEETSVLITANRMMEMNCLLATLQSSDQTIPMPSEKLFRNYLGNLKSEIISSSKGSSKLTYAPKGIKSAKQGWTIRKDQKGKFFIDYPDPSPPKLLCFRKMGESFLPEMTSHTCSTVVPSYFMLKLKKENTSLHLGGTDEQMLPAEGFDRIWFKENKRPKPECPEF